MYDYSVPENGSTKLKLGLSQHNFKITFCLRLVKNKSVPSTVHRRQENLVTLKEILEFLCNLSAVPWEPKPLSQISTSSCLYASGHPGRGPHGRIYRKKNGGKLEQKSNISTLRPRNCEVF